MNKGLKDYRRKRHCFWFRKSWKATWRKKHLNWIFIDSIAIGRDGEDKMFWVEEMQQKQERWDCTEILRMPFWNIWIYRGQLVPDWPEGLGRKQKDQLRPVQALPGQGGRVTCVMNVIGSGGGEVRRPKHQWKEHVREHLWSSWLAGLRGL